MYNFIKKHNFVNRNLPEVSLEKLKNQIEDAYCIEDNGNQLYNAVRHELSAEKIYKNYANEINNSNFFSMYNFTDIFEVIKQTNNKFENFYESKEIYNILRNYIGTNCLSVNLKIYFNSYDNYFNVIDKSQKEINSLETTIKDDINNMKNEMTSIKEEISSIKEEVINIKEEISSIKEEMINEKSEICNIKEEIEQIKINQYETENKINVKFLAYNTFRKMKNKKKE